MLYNFSKSIHCFTVNPILSVDKYCLNMGKYPGNPIYSVYNFVKIWANIQYILSTLFRNLWKYGPISWKYYLICGEICENILEILSYPWRILWKYGQTPVIPQILVVGNNVGTLSIGCSQFNWYKIFSAILGKPMPGQYLCGPLIFVHTNT